MSNKFVLIISLILNLTSIAAAQVDKNKLQFGVLSQNGSFYNELKNTDVNIEGAENLSLTQRLNNPLELIIMIDASVSQEKMMPQQRKAAQTLINSFLKPEKDKVAIASFSLEVVLEQDFTNDFEKAAAKIESIDFVRPKNYVGGGVLMRSKLPGKNSTGSTSIWDSTKQVLDGFSKLPNNDARRAIVLISDGVNTSGDSKLKETIEQSLKTRIPIYAIGIGDPFYDSVDEKTLKKVTGETGGISVIPDEKLKDIIPLLTRIEQLMRSYYELTFDLNPSISKNKSPEIKIEFTNNELVKKKLKIVQPKISVIQ